METTRWKNALKEKVENEALEEEEARNILEKEIAEIYNVPVSTVWSAYEEIKKKNKRPVDDDILELGEEEKKLINSFKLYEQKDNGVTEILPRHIEGEIVDVIVTSIASYGVFAEIEEEGRVGLIHITEVKDDYVELDRHFRVGDKLKARVIKHGEDGKLAFSVKGMEIPDYYQQHNPFSKLETYKSKIQVTEEEKEMQEIIKYMGNIVGIVSPDARKYLKEIMKKHGVFKFTLEMVKVLEESKNDAGVLLLKAIEKEMGNRL